jgi:tetratricopeptide (TPR) repeat protein
VVLRPNFADLSPTEFEAFTVDLLRTLGFSNLDWRKGAGGPSSPADGGRDIVADLRRMDIDGAEVTEHWFVECKHSQRAVPAQELQPLLAAASAHRPDVALFIVSGFLSNPAKDFLASYVSENKPAFRIKYLESPDLVEFCRDHPKLIARHFETSDEVQSMADDLALRLADAELGVRLGEDFQDALEELLHATEAAGLASLAVRARTALAASANAAGQCDRTVGLLEPLVEQLDPVAHTDALTHLGRAYTWVGRTHDAVTLFEQAIAKLDASVYRDPTLRMRLQMQLSYALSDLGDVDRAREVLEDVTSTALPDDPYMHVRMYWSTARLLHAEGRYDDSLSYLRRALATFDSSESTLHLARAHLLAGTIALRRDSVEAAEASVGAATTLLGLGATAADKAQLSLLSAQLRFRVGELDAAADLAMQARDSSPDSPRLQVEAERLLASVRRAQGREEDALAHLDRAATIAMRVPPET